MFLCAFQPAQECPFIGTPEGCPIRYVARTTQGLRRHLVVWHGHRLVRSNRGGQRFQTAVPLGPEETARRHAKISARSGGLRKRREALRNMRGVPSRPVRRNWRCGPYGAGRLCSPHHSPVPEVEQPDESAVAGSSTTFDLEHRVDDSSSAANSACGRGLLHRPWGARCQATSTWTPQNCTGGLYPYRPTDYRSPDASEVTDSRDDDDGDADIDDIGMDDSDVVEIQQMIELQPVCGVRPGLDMSLVGAPEPLPFEQLEQVPSPTSP